MGLVSFILFLSIYGMGTLNNPHTCLKMVGGRRPWWYGPSQGLGDYEPAVILDLYCCGDPAKLENLNKLNSFAQHQTNFRLIENLCMEPPSYL